MELFFSFLLVSFIAGIVFSKKSQVWLYVFAGVAAVGLAAIYFYANSTL
ncbi:MAG: hypothetical protein AAF902_00795 [Chloroflexota bacterium]